MNNLINLLLISTATTAHKKKVDANYSKYVYAKAKQLRTPPCQHCMGEMAYSEIPKAAETKAPLATSSEIAQLHSLYVTDEATGMPISTGPFSLPPLEYDYNALEPYIDEATMRVHHDSHHANYVRNLNAVLSRYPEFYDYTLEELLLFSDRLPSDIQTQTINNAGGHYNHSLTWKLIGPPQNTEP